MAELLILNPITSASASLMRMEIYTTTHLVICKPILIIRHMYIMKMSRKAEATTTVMTTMKAKVITTMTPMNRK